MDEEEDRFAALMLQQRTLPDGSLIPPELIVAADQMPLTREVVGRRSLKKKGTTKRLKIQTAGKVRSGVEWSEVGWGGVGLLGMGRGWGGVVYSRLLYS